jgi:predicted alpha/beta-fold hydrolase
MPILSTNFRAKGIHKHSHVSTIYPVFFRKVETLPFSRERIKTPDQDFFEVDWYRQGSNQLVVLTHGLEGSSQQNYMQASTHYFFKQGYDVVAMNFRSCSGIMNLKPRLYHSGETQDLRWLLKQLTEHHNYQAIFLMGFSLGGNVILKYLGEEGKSIHPSIKKAVTFSVPIDLESCSYSLAKGFNRIYSENFMRSLRKKVEYIREKHQLDYLMHLDTRKLKTFLDFDELVTAPVFGFDGAKGYWNESSSLGFIPEIKIPTLLVNALNDPFLGQPCYPKDLAKSSELFHLETPRHGGHVGFMEDFKENWFTKRACQFIEKSE